MSLARTKPMKRGGRLNPKSAKRQAEDAFDGQRAQVREATRDRDRKCVADGFVPGVPCTEGAETDERQGRGRLPGSHLDLDQTQILCPLCHRVKTAEPLFAGVLGLNGLAEQDRLLDEAADQVHAIETALGGFARAKAIAAGMKLPVGGNPLAVQRLRERRQDERHAPR